MYPKMDAGMGQKSLSVGHEKTLGQTPAPREAEINQEMCRLNMDLAALDNAVDFLVQRMQETGLLETHPLPAAATEGGPTEKGPRTPLTIAMRELSARLSSATARLGTIVMYSAL